MQKLSLTNKYTSYPKYKDSGVEWVGKVPESWDVASMRRLFGSEKNLASETDFQKVLSLTLQGVIPRVLDGSGKNPANYDTYQEFQKDDLVFCLFDYDVTPRTIGYVRENGMMTGAYTRLIPKNETYSKFYYYYFLSLDYTKELLHLCTGLRNSISKPLFWSMKNPLPPKEEQETIARFLDEQTARIDETIAKKKKLIELLKEKRTAVINNAVTKGLDPKAELVDSCIGWIGKIPKGWSVKRLGLVTKISASNVDKLTEEGQKIVRVCNYVDVYKNEYITEDLNFVNASASAPQVSKFSLLSGDILLTKDSETANDIGVPAFVPINIEGAVVGYHIYQARVTDKTLLPEFLFRYLQSSFANAWFENKARGVTRFGLGSHGVKSLPILGPTHNEQTEIASFIRQQTDIVDKAKNQIEKSILLLQELKSSLISHAVTGKIKI